MSFTKNLSRRDFVNTLIKAYVSYVLVSSVTVQKAWSASIEPEILKWAKGVGELGHSVQTGKITPLIWQSEMEKLYQKLSVSNFNRFIEKDKLLQSIQYPRTSIGAVADVNWPQIEGFPSDLKFGHKIFVYRKGSVTPPHAHNNMVSAHFVIEGEIRCRTFDRKDDLNGRMLIQPVRDEIAKPGALISMSDDQENVHWFEGASDRSISFDIPIVDISLEKKYTQKAGGYNQIFLDPTVAPKSNGMIEAPIISFEESLKRFSS